MPFEEIAEAWILRVIGQLKADETRIVMAKLLALGADYESVDQLLDEFEREQSVPVALQDWVEAEWAENQAASASQTPAQFAKARVEDVLTSLE